MAPEAERAAPTRYDRIGAGYAATRQEDPRIAGHVRADAGLRPQVVGRAGRR